MWKSTWTCWRLEGICWATWIKFTNLPKNFNHLGNISSDFLQIDLIFLASLENFWTFFHVAWDFGQQWNRFLTSIIYPKLSTGIFKIPKLPYYYYYYLDHWDFSRVPNIFGQINSKTARNVLSILEIFCQKFFRASGFFQSAQSFGQKWNFFQSI